MRYYIILFAAILFFACNDDKTSNNGISNVDMPAKEKELRDLILKYPDSLLMKENLIQYFVDNANFGQAIAETNNWLKKDTGSEKLWYTKANLHLLNNDTADAITALEETIKHSTKPTYLMDLGSLYASTKNPLAIGMADILAAYGPSTQYQSLFIRGLFYSNTSDKQKAIALFDQCIVTSYTNMIAYREKAIAEYDMGKYVEALKTLELALSVQKTYDEGYYWIGRCLEKLGKRDQAIENYKMALQISEDFDEAKDALVKLGVAL